MAKQTVYETVFDQEQYDGDWPSTNLEEAIAWFKKKLKSIPAEHRHTATLEIDTHSGYYDSSYAHIEIQYTRLETDEEMSAREAKERKEAEYRAASIKANELAVLAALKQKYGQ